MLRDSLNVAPPRRWPCPEYTPPACDRICSHNRAIRLSAYSVDPQGEFKKDCAYWVAWKSSPEFSGAPRSVVSSVPLDAAILAKSAFDFPH